MDKIKDILKTIHNYHEKFISRFKVIVSDEESEYFEIDKENNENQIKSDELFSKIENIRISWIGHAFDLNRRLKSSKYKYLNRFYLLLLVGQIPVWVLLIADPESPIFGLLHILWIYSLYIGIKIVNSAGKARIEYVFKTDKKLFQDFTDNISKLKQSDWTLGDFPKEYESMNNWTPNVTFSAIEVKNVHYLFLPDAIWVDNSIPILYKDISIEYSEDFSYDIFGRTTQLDTKMVLKTWLHINLDGKPDQRHTDNSRIEIFESARIKVKTLKSDDEEILSIWISNRSFGKEIVEKLGSGLGCKHSIDLMDKSSIDRNLQFTLLPFYNEKARESIINKRYG
jgi:hypothetical protein